MAPTRVERLAESQLALLNAVRDEWVTHALCTQVVSRPVAEAAIAKLYEAANLPPPSQIVWCGSPLSMMLSLAVLHRAGRDLTSNVEAATRQRVLRAVHEKVCALASKEVHASAWGSVEESVRHSGRVRVGPSVREMVWERPLRDAWRRAIKRCSGEALTRVWATVHQGVWARAWAGFHAAFGLTIWPVLRQSAWDSVPRPFRAEVPAMVRDTLWAGVGEDSAAIMNRTCSRARVRDTRLHEAGLDLPWHHHFWETFEEDFLASFSGGGAPWRSLARMFWHTVEGNLETQGSDDSDEWWTSYVLRQGIVRSGVGPFVRGSLFGQHEADSVALFDAFGRLGLQNVAAPLAGSFELTKSAGWVYPTLHTCWVTERPRRLLRDDEGRLHCVDGPALAYADGFAVYAIHGVHIDGDHVEHPERISAEMIATQGNAEVSRVLMGLYGEDKYLRDIGAQVLASDLDGSGQPRRLYQAWVPWSVEPLRMVCVVNATPESDGTLKPYFLRVPPDVHTPADAVAWTFGMSGAEYAPAVET